MKYSLKLSEIVSSTSMSSFPPGVGVVRILMYLILSLLFFTNEEGMIIDIQYESPLGKSDHCVLIFNLKCYSPLASPGTSKKNFARGDFKSLRKKLDLDWDAEFSDVQDDVSAQWNRFITIFHKAIDDCIPTPSPSHGPRNRIPHEFLNSFLKEKRKKSRCWQRFLESRYTNDKDAK